MADWRVAAEGVEVLERPFLLLEVARREDGKWWWIVLRSRSRVVLDSGTCGTAEEAKRLAEKAATRFLE